MNAVEREVQFHIGRGAKSKKQVRQGGAKLVQDKVPRIARLMALAIHFDLPIREGKVKDYAEIARLGGVTRGRVTQVMNLLNLSPALQENLLAIDRHDTNERIVRRVTSITQWSDQQL